MSTATLDAVEVTPIGGEVTVRIYADVIDLAQTIGNITRTETVPVYACPMCQGLVRQHIITVLADGFQHDASRDLCIRPKDPMLDEINQRLGR